MSPSWEIARLGHLIPKTAVQMRGAEVNVRSTLVNRRGKNRSELFQVSDDGTNVSPDTRYLDWNLAQGISK